MRIQNKMISFYYNTGNPYRLCGINHFSQKYGISLSFNTKSKLNIVYNKLCKDMKKINIQIIENEIQKDISGYLKTNTEKIPLFEKPKRFDENGENLVIFVDNEGDEYPCIISKENMITISFDIFNEIGHILAGHLERFWTLNNPESKQLMKIPVVDCYEKILFDCIKFAGKKLNIQFEHEPFWPNNKKFAVCLTHDVDRIKKTFQYVTHTIRNLKKGEISLALSQLSSLVRRENPYWNFDRIIEMERRQGVKSTFFFLNEQRKACLLSPGEWKLYWGRFDIKNKRIVEVIKKLDAEGWEISVHGSYNSYRNLEMMGEEKETLEEILGKRVHGISQHYCNLEIPSTWEYQEKLGFSYDASIGFVTDIGFRWGTCHPFRPFNPENGSILSLWELPIIIMDNACAYISWHDIMEIINTVERYNGLLLLRWHQAVFNEREFPGRSKIYERIIKECKERNAWITNAHDIVEWLIMREKFPSSAKWTLNCK